MKRMSSLAANVTLFLGGVSHFPTGYTHDSAVRRFRKIFVAAILINATLSLPAATMTVSNLNDSGAGTLRQLVGTSNAGDTIVVPSGILILNSSITIPHSLAIQGPGPGALILDAGGMDRAFVIASGDPVILSGMTITDGFVQGTNGPNGTESSPAGQPGGGVEGGAILDENGSGSDVLIVSNCWFTANRAQGGNGGDGHDGLDSITSTPDGPGGQGGNAAGGAIVGLGQIILDNCTFSENSAVGGQGGLGGNFSSDFANAFAQPGGPGGNVNGGAVVCTVCHCINCTFALNVVEGGAGGQGGNCNWTGGDGGLGGTASGGALSGPNPPSSFISCTIYSNSAVAGSGGLGGSGMSAGMTGSPGQGLAGGVIGYTIGQGCSVDIANTILSDNDASTEYQNYVEGWNDDGFNFIGSDDGTCPWGNTTKVGTVASPIHAYLKPLAENGGGLPTLAPIFGLSPVIDQGSSFGLTTDERGAPRPVIVTQNVGLWGDGSDIGAFELGSPSVGFAVDTHHNLILSWPGFYGDFMLLSALNLQGLNQSSNAPYAPVLVGNQFMVTIPLTNPAQFFRLEN
jgi:hypothetical protein